MFALLSPRLWLALALAAMLALTHGMAYRSGRGAIQGKWDKERAEIVATALTASETARLREQAAQKANERIGHDYQTQKTKLAADKRVTDDSLRSLQAAINQPSAVASTTSGAYGTGGLERELLGICATSFAEMGFTADRLEAKVVGLQSYVLSVCQGNKP